MQMHHFLNLTFTHSFLLNMRLIDYLMKRGGVCSIRSLIKIKWVEGDPSFVPHLLMERYWCLLRKPSHVLVLILPSLSLQVAMVTWVPGHHPNNGMGFVSMPTRDQRGGGSFFLQVTPERIWSICSVLSNASSVI